VTNAAVAALAAAPPPKRRAATKKPSTDAASNTMSSTVASSPKRRGTSTSNKKQPPAAAATDSVLFTLDDPESVLCTLLQRPSKRNRSPYVADLCIPSQDSREAICHVPNLDMGGKCVPGVTILCKPARDRKGNLVGPDAVSPKYGTPKCEYIAQLIHVDESALSDHYIPTWVGAHPSLGERIAHELIQQGRLFDNVTDIKREVSKVEGMDMRADFVLTEEDGRKHVVEVKTVVDADYSTHHGLPDRAKCVFTSEKLPYKRTAIFPWGQSKQKGPDGEKVVSARAIKHVRELTKLANMEGYKSTVLFIVIRGDAETFRPNYDACPSFCKYLKQAQEAGVQILAKRVTWNVTERTAQCIEDKVLEIEWPTELTEQK